MSFDMYGDVTLTRDVTDRGLRAGDVRTVVERHAAPGVTEEGYSVEFFDLTGNTVTVVTLPASALRLPTASRSPNRARPEALSPPPASCRLLQPVNLSQPTLHLVPTRES